MNELKELAGWTDAFLKQFAFCGIKLDSSIHVYVLLSNSNLVVSLVMKMMMKLPILLCAEKLES